MQEDRVIGASNEFFAVEPDDQKKARTDERSEVLRELPQIQRIIDRLQERANHYGTVEAIPADIRLEPAKLAIRIDSMAETKANLEAEIGLLEALIVEHIE